MFSTGEFREIRAGTQTSLRLCRLTVRPHVRSGPTYTGLVAESSTKNTGTAIPTGLSGPTIHVLDRSADSHRKASSPRPTAHGTQKVASQKQLEGTRITRKGDPYSQVTAPPSIMVTGRRQCTPKPTVTLNKSCSADLYRCIKRRVGHLLKRAHCKRDLVPFEKQAAYKLFGSKSSLSSRKRVPRPVLLQDSSCSNRQHHSGVIHKQGRRLEVLPTLCPTMENLDLVYQKASDSNPDTFQAS